MRSILILLLLFPCAALAEPAPPGGAPRSAVFPLCWGGRGNDALTYVEGLTLRQLFLYSNPSKEQAVTGVRLVVEVPAEGIEVTAAVMSDGYGRTKTEMRREVVERDGRQVTQITCPMWDIKPGFTWKGDRPWSQWPGWWSALYVKGVKPGRYSLAWHLESDQGNEAENTAAVVVLRRPPAPARTSDAPGAGVGVWAYSLSTYGDFPEVIDGLAESLAACGVRRAYAASGATATVKALKARGVEVAFTNPWHYSVFAPAQPPDEARAVNEKGERIPLIGGGFRKSEQIHRGTAPWHVELALGGLSARAP